MKYETVFIGRQDLADSQVSDLTTKFTDIIKNDAGELKVHENWGLRTMAYRINNNKKGHYVLLQYQAPASTVKEIERLMRLNEDILRFMTLKIDDFNEGPSIFMQRQEEGDERSKFKSKSRGHNTASEAMQGA